MSMTETSQRALRAKSKFDRYCIIKQRARNAYADYGFPAYDRYVSMNPKARIPEIEKLRPQPVVRHFEPTPILVGMASGETISVDELFCVALCGPFGRPMPC